MSTMWSNLLYKLCPDRYDLRLWLKKVPNCPAALQVDREKRNEGLASADATLSFFDIPRKMCAAELGKWVMAVINKWPGIDLNRSSKRRFGRSSL